MAMIEAKKIVLVSDSRAVLDKIGEALKETIESKLADYRFFIDPKKFLWELLEDGLSYDLLIYDIDALEREKFELINIIKHDERFFHLPIIAISAQISDTLKERGRKEGVLGWIRKPFESPHLALIVKLTTGIQR
jgi:PleD family two-component response regulator